MRRVLPVTGVLVLPVLLLCLAGCPGDRPVTAGDCNLIFISIDTLRADHLGCYGYHRDTSPTIDALAEQSIIFKNAYSHSPKTTPSHMSMFTSLYPTVHNVYLDINLGGSLQPYRLDEKIRTLAEYYEEAGYTNAAFTGGGHISGTYGFDRGFGKQYFVDNHWKRVSKWIADNRRKQFLVFLHTYIVHDPYQPPEPWYSMFVDPGYGGSIKPSSGEGWKEVHDAYWAQVDKDDPEDIGHLLALYDGAIRHMDETLIKPLLQRLDQYGLMEKTIIVFTSDHGEEFMEHGKVLHNQIYDEILRVPLMIYLPPQISGPLARKNVEAQVRLIDIMPTLLELMGVAHDPATFQGSSLRACWEGDETTDRPVYSTQFRSHGKTPGAVRSQSLRHSGYKLIRKQTREAMVHQLFNVENDKQESEDLFSTDQPSLDALERTLQQISSQNQAMAETLGAEAEETTLKPETVKQLEALGYIK